MKGKKLESPQPLDQRGVTLQTVIIIAVLALAATGGGIVIYNVIGQRSGEVNQNALNTFFLEPIKPEQSPPLPPDLNPPRRIVVEQSPPPQHNPPVEDPSSQVSKEEKEEADEEDKGYVRWESYVKRSEVLGESHSCAIHSDRTVSCWGWGRDGQLGDGNFYEGEKEHPEGTVKAREIRDAKALTTGRRHTCVLHLDTTISCWGEGASNALGTTDFQNSAVPRKIVRPDRTPRRGFIQVDAGNSFTCALHEDGYIVCWGDSRWGYLRGGRVQQTLLEIPSRTGNIAPEELFVRPQEIKDATYISAGRSHVCALHRDTTISCWGHNRYGQATGTTNTPDFRQLSPSKIIDEKGDVMYGFTSVKSGDLHTCGLRGNGDLWCWGIFHNHPDEDTGEHTGVPVEMKNIPGYEAMSEARSLHGEYDYHCIIRTDDTVWCRGALRKETEDPEFNYYLYQYNGALEITEAHPALLEAKGLEVGFGHACALLADSSVFCWGDGRYGELAGNGLTDVIALGT